MIQLHRTERTTTWIKKWVYKPIALCSGLPVNRSHAIVVSRWFVIPIAVCKIHKYKCNYLQVSIQELGNKQNQLSMDAILSINKWVLLVHTLCSPWFNLHSMPILNRRSKQTDLNLNLECCIAYDQNNMEVCHGKFQWFNKTMFLGNYIYIRLNIPFWDVGT